MPGTCCCVPLCKNRGGHQFPKNISLRRKWLAAIRRDKWYPSEYSLVCSNHFKVDDYIQETTRGGYSPLVMRLRKEVVPSLFSWTKEESAESQQRKLRCLNREKSHLTVKRRPGCSYDGKINNATVSLLETKETMAGDLNIGSNVEICTSSVCYQDQSIQTDICTTKDSWTQGGPCPNIPMKHNYSFALENYNNNPKTVHFYTGLENYKKVVFVLYTLGPAASHLNYIYGPPPPHITVLNQFFMTLVILRQHKTYFEVSDWFKCTVKDVHNILITWIKFAALQWREIDIWTERSMVRFNSPSDFKQKYPTTRVILDATECPIKKPCMPTAQQATFSSYKNCNTVKVVIGITPSGLITYVSPSYGGSTSDRQIIERSDLFTKCDSGDSIMVDKGFNVQDLFAPYNVTINIPTFFRKGSKIASSAIERDRKIASKRVHVERSIGLLKTFKILKGPLNATETILSGEIFFVCAMLCNFRHSIVGKDA